MKRLFLILLCITLTGCTYLGVTEDILISSPSDISISTIETFGSVPIFTDQGMNPITGDAETDENGQPIVPAVTTVAPPAPITHIMISKTGDKIHYYENCSYAQRIKEENRQVLPIDQEAQLLSDGYTVCSWCAKQRGE